MTDTKNTQLAELTENRRNYIESLFKQGFQKIPGKVQVVASSPNSQTKENRVNVFQVIPLKSPEIEGEPSLETSLEAGREILGKMIEENGLKEAKNFMVYAYSTFIAIANGETEIDVPDGYTKADIETQLIYGFWMFAAHMQDTAEGTGVIEILDSFMFLTPRFQFKEE